MKICLTARGENPESSVDPVFGRAKYFVFYDTETKEKEVIENPNTEKGGAGIKSAHLMRDKDVELVVSGKIGPNVETIFEMSGIEFRPADTEKNVEENLKMLGK
jgi:predicted Fe-Mo cluster-binding NifX family protein